MKEKTLNQHQIALQKLQHDIRKKYWYKFKSELILTVVLAFLGALFIAAKYGGEVFLEGLKMTLLAGIAIYVPRAVCLPRLATIDEEKEAAKIKKGISVYNKKILEQEIEEIQNDKIIKYEQNLGKILLGQQNKLSKSQTNRKDISD